jgi:uncharacterized membrane protein
VAFGPDVIVMDVAIANSTTCAAETGLTVSESPGLVVVPFYPDDGQSGGHGECWCVVAGDCPPALLLSAILAASEMHERRATDA